MMKFIIIFKRSIIFQALLITIIFPTSILAETNLNQINQKVCSRFEEDVSKLAAIMEEVRERKGITETRVAFGGIDDQIKSADYWITYTAEAIAFQKYQKPLSVGGLKSSLESLRGKVLRAKIEVGRALQ